MANDQKKENDKEGVVKLSTWGLSLKQFITKRPSK